MSKGKTGQGRPALLGSGPRRPFDAGRAFRDHEPVVRQGVMDRDGDGESVLDPSRRDHLKTHAHDDTRPAIARRLSGGVCIGQPFLQSGTFRAKPVQHPARLRRDGKRQAADDGDEKGPQARHARGLDPESGKNGANPPRAALSAFADHTRHLTVAILPRFGKHRARRRNQPPSQDGASAELSLCTERCHR